MLWNQLFATIWKGFQAWGWKCLTIHVSELSGTISKLGAEMFSKTGGRLSGLGAENASKWHPQDWKLAFWVFEISSVFLENSGLELKMHEDMLFAAIWSVIRVWSWKYLKMAAFWGLGAEYAQIWFPQDWKWAFWVFEFFQNSCNSSLELNMCENVL